MKIFFVLILVLLVVYLPASQSLPKKQLYIGSVVLTVEIASTSDSRSRGLVSGNIELEQRDVVCI